MNSVPFQCSPACQPSEAAILFITDKTEFGHAASLDFSQHLIDDDIAGLGIRLELQFRFGNHLRCPVQILTSRHQIDRRAIPGNDARSINCRSEEHTSELQSLMSISYAVFCLQQKKIT